jgi:hypothetical protein
MRPQAFLAAMGAIGMLIGTVQAQEVLPPQAGAEHHRAPPPSAGGTPPDPAAPPRWEFTLTPYVWLPALRGTLQTPLPRIGERSAELSSGTVFADIDGPPVMVSGEVRYGRFAVVADVVHSALRQDLQTPRDLLFEGGHARVVNTIATVLGMVRVVETPAQGAEIGAGFRYWSFDNKLSFNPGLLPGVIAKSSTQWAEPVIAARYGASLSPRFGLSVYADVGSFETGSRLSWQAVGSADYAIADNVTLRAGWRYLHVERTRGDFRFDLAYNGPFFAVSFRF